MKKKKLKILYLTQETYPTFRVDITELFANEFNLLGHKIAWIFRSEEPLKKTKIFRWQGHLAILTPSSQCKNRLLKKLHNLLLDRIREYYVFYLANRKKYDFIQVRDDVLSATIVLCISKWVKIPFIYWMSFPLTESGMDYALKKPKWYGWALYLKWYAVHQLLYKFVLPSSRFVFAQSEQMKINLINLGVTAEKITPIPMGVQLRNFNEDQFKYIKHADKYVISYLGSLEANRHIYFLVEVLAEVIKKIPTAYLLFVGDGGLPTDKNLIYDKARELNLLDKIELTGMIKREAAWSRIKSSDVCVSPIYPSPFFVVASPTKLLEYMTLQKPVVVNNIPEQKEIIKNSQVGLCVEWDVKEFADAIIYLYENPSIAENMGNQGLDYIKKFHSYEILAKKLEAHYLSLTN